MFTQWASDNDLKLQFILATPVFEPFADQTLPYLSTYNGVTNISNDDALSTEMTVKYPTTDASGVVSRNESRIAELAKDTDDKFDEVNSDLKSITNQGDVTDFGDNGTGGISWITVGNIFTIVNVAFTPSKVLDNVQISSNFPRAKFFKYNLLGSWGNKNVPNSLMAVNEFGNLQAWSGADNVGHTIFGSFIYF